MRKVRKQKVFVGMSGGVDSSVAAFLLKEQGYDVVGVFMRCYNLDGCAERDSEDARRTAQKIGIPFYVWDFEQAYKDRVVDYMIRGYEAGLTPNPDVMCNREIKFGLFSERALALGADFVATGHYARIAEMNGRLALARARDTNKDQSYFLWTLTPDDLARCLFPIGEYLKPEVRAIARKAGLPTADKKDSQGICFLGQVSASEFLKKYIPTRRGDVLTLAGEKIGEHDGAHFYTIGQRQGIGEIKHQKGNRVHSPVYVAEKDVAANTVTVAAGEDPALFRKEVHLAELNLAAYGNVLREVGMPVEARVRYRQPLAPAVFKMQGERGVLSFAKPQRFVAPGQSAVFYDADGILLGGGIIV